MALSLWMFLFETTLCALARHLRHQSPLGVVVPSGSSRLPPKRRCLSAAASAPMRPSACSAARQPACKDCSKRLVKNRTDDGDTDTSALAPCEHMCHFCCASFYGDDDDMLWRCDKCEVAFCDFCTENVPNTAMITPKESRGFVPGQEHTQHVNERVEQEDFAEFDAASNILLKCKRLGEVPAGLRDEFGDTLWHSLCLGLSRTLYAHSPAINTRDNIARHLKDASLETLFSPPLVAFFFRKTCVTHSFDASDIQLAAMYAVSTNVFAELLTFCLGDTKIKLCKDNADILLKSEEGIDAAHEPNRVGTTAAMMAARFNLVTAGWTKPNPLLAYIVEHSSKEQLEKMFAQQDEWGHDIYDYACTSENNKRYLWHKHAEID